MKKRYINLVTLLVLISLNSCAVCDNYYYKVNKNKVEFYTIVEYIRNNKILVNKDSIVLNNQKTIYFNSKCVYYSKYDKGNKLTDNVLIEFMDKYSLDRICLEERNDNFYNSVITFHKNYNPILGKSKTIDFDFGKSPIRDRIVLGKKKEGNYSIRIIDSLFIYSINKNPAFGE